MVRPIIGYFSGAIRTCFMKRRFLRFPNEHSTLSRRLNGFLGLSLNDKTILFLVILLDKTVSVG